MAVLRPLYENISGGYTIADSDDIILEDVTSSQEIDITRSTEEEEPLQSIIDEYGNKSGEYNLIIPEGKTYEVDSVISCPYDNINLKLYGRLIYTGSENKPILTIGDPSLQIKGLYHSFNVQRENASDWTNSENVGVRLYNHVNSYCNVVSIVGNTTGLDLVGDGNAFAYNSFDLNELRNNQIHIHLRNVNAGGYTNENKFENGRFTNDSTFNTGSPRYGVVISGDSGNYINMNNNIFDHPTFELKDFNSEAIVLENNSRFNFFLECRFETNTEVANIKDSAYGNIITAAFTDTESYIDSSSNGNNFVKASGRPELYEINSKLFEFTDLGRRANYWDQTSGGRVYCDGLSFGNSGNDNVQNFINNISISNDYIDIDASRAIGQIIDTENVKEFIVKRSALNGNGGRVVVRCYDSNDTIIGGSGQLTSTPYASLVYDGAYFGGTYKTGSDGDFNAYFKVGSNVSYIWVGIAGGQTTNAQLKSFSVYTQPTNEDVNYYPGHPDSYGQGYMAIEAPQAGRHEVGDFVWEGSGSATVLGWKCTTAGDPATFTQVSV